MDIQHLREFVILGRSLSISSAAKTAHLAPSTLSKHVSALEQELGVELVARTSNSLNLTQEGRLLLEGTIDVVDRWDRTVQAVRDSRRQHRPVVHLGGNLFNLTATELAHRAISLIARQQLSVTVEFYSPHTSFTEAEMAAHDEYEAVLERLVDVSIMATAESYDWSPFEHQVLFREPFTAYVPQADPLAEHDHVSLNDLRHKTFMKTMSNSNYWMRVREACLLSGFDPEFRTRVADSSPSFLVAAEPDEVFIVTASGAARGLVAPPEVSGLVQLNLQDENAYYEFWAVYRTDSTNEGIPIFLAALEAASGAESAR